MVVMASAALAPAVLPCQEGRLAKVNKECKSLVTYQAKRQDAFLHLRAHYLDEQPRSIWPDSPINPVFIDVQESRHLSFGTENQSTIHDKILQNLLLSSSNPSEKPNLSFLPDLTGFQTVPINMNHHPQFLNNDLINYKIPNLERQNPMPSSLLNFVGTMSKSSLLSIDPSGRILFSGNGSEMKDLLSILSEFDLYNQSPADSKAALLVPYFERSRLLGRAVRNVSVLKFPTDTLAPLKSPGTIITKPTKKKKQNKSRIKNRDIFQQNHFQAFESLLSVLLDKKINTNTNTNTNTYINILSLKKSGPKIADILTHFSIGIISTGLAILLSVSFKRAPLCGTTVLSMSFGFGLFWFYSVVNGLRDTIVEVFKMSNKIKMKDEEIAWKVERSMKDVVFVACMLFALAVLRFV